VKELRPTGRVEAPRSPFVYLLAFAVVIGLLVTLARVLAGCAALAAAVPAIEAAAPGIVSLVTAELQRAGVPATDPAYQTAIAAAQALEARQADHDAAMQAELDTILAAVRAQPRCPASKPPPVPATVLVRAQPLPVPLDAGKDAP
jgi:hypothetical protein